jgi:hypothetical protein
MVRFRELLDELIDAVKRKRRVRGSYQDTRLNEAIRRLEGLRDRTQSTRVCSNEVRREFCDILLDLKSAGLFRP